MPSETTVLEFAAGDPGFAPIVASAEKTTRLLRSTRAGTEVRLVGCLDDLLGAAYALVLATQAGFRERTAPIETDKVLRRADLLVEGKLRTDGAWMAGFHLNSGMYRLSAAYDRILKLVPFACKYEKESWKAAEREYGWQSANIRAVHAQVNAMKHERRGLHDTRHPDAGLSNAVAGLGELVDLLEEWEKRGAQVAGSSATVS